MHKTTIKNLETNVQKKCDILKKNDKVLEVVIENTTIKLTLFKKNSLYVGRFKDLEFISSGN